MVVNRELDATCEVSRPSLVRRFGAFGVDCLAFIPVSLALKWVFGPWLDAIFSPLFFGYVLVGDLGPQTIGRRVLGVRVSNWDDSRNLSLSQAALRELPAFVLWINSLALLLAVNLTDISVWDVGKWAGWSMLAAFCFVLFDFAPVVTGRSAQAWHDRISSSGLRNAPRQSGFRPIRGV